MRLFIYSQDGMGLGHLRRTLNIAREVISRCEDASVLVVADSPVAPFFPEVPGVCYLKLPTLVKTGDASWCAHDGGLGNTIEERAKKIAEACRHHVIHVGIGNHILEYVREILENNDALGAGVL